jgi:hypothetical protein
MPSWLRDQATSIRLTSEVMYFYFRHRHCDGVHRVNTINSSGIWCPVHEDGKGIWWANASDDLAQRVVNGELSLTEAQAEIIDRVTTELRSREPGFRFGAKTERIPGAEYGNDIHRRLEGHYKQMGPNRDAQDRG